MPAFGAYSRAKSSIGSQPRRFSQASQKERVWVNRAAPRLSHWDASCVPTAKPAGLPQKELARRLGYTNAWLSSLETAQLRPRTDQVTVMEQALGLPPGALLAVYEQLDGESLPGWFRPWLDEEKETTVIRSFEQAVIPGLLQTEDYARVLFNGDAKAVQARMERQAILARERPPMLHVVIDEGALYQGRGGARVMREQLDHLRAAVAPRITLQVVPSAVNPRSMGAFMIANVNGGEVGYAETTLRGIVTNSRADLAGLSAAWEAIRTFALSQ